MHYYKRNIGDYHKKAGRLSLLQHGVYTILMDAIYDREKFPTKEEAIDWCWASTPEEVAAVDFVLGKFFVNGDGIYRQKRIEEEIKSFAEFCERQKEKGKKGGRPKGENKPGGIIKEPAGFLKEPGETQSKAEQSLPTNHNPPRVDKPTLDNSPNGESGNSKSSPVPYQKIIDLYHECCPKFPRVVKLTEKRKKAIRARWKDDADNLEFWESYFKHAAMSKFLNGQNDRGWVADIDFLISERAVVGMQEGKYHGQIPRH